MKTFREFLEEASNKYGIPDDEYRQWQQDRTVGKGPARKTFNGVKYEMRSKSGAGKPKVWAVSTVSSRQASSSKRNKAEAQSKLTTNELLSATGGDKERASLALDTEQSRIKKTGERVRRVSKATGIRQSLGHKNPLQPETPSPEDPGHTSSNIVREPLGSNAAKKNKRPEPGESGYGLTRSQAIQDAKRRGDTLGRRIDTEIKLTRSGKPSRAARLLAKLRKPKPKFQNSAERAKEQKARMASAQDKRIDDALNA